MSKKRESGFGRQLISQMFTAMFFTAVAFLVLAVLVWWAGNNRAWQGWEPNYELFRWIKDNFLLVGACGLLAVWFLVDWWFLRRALKSTETLLQAAKQLADPGEEPIRLPAALKAAEDELNLAREQALRSAYVAREAEQRKNDLIVYLAHDLKTPLTSVVGYLTLLQEEPDLSPEMRGRYTGVALDKALRLEELINEFFEITRFNLSAIELEKERVDVSRMLEQMMWEFKPLMADKGLEWQAQLPPKVMLTCDAGKMERVLDNIIRNAISYSEPGSPLLLTLAQQPGKVVIRLENRGRTIPPEVLSRLFERFYRADSARATRSGGAGLGLAIAKEIVTRHGGQISAESYDNRVIFTVEMPAS